MTEAAQIAAHAQPGDQVAKLRLMSMRDLGSYHAHSAFAYAAEAERNGRAG